MKNDSRGMTAVAARMGAGALAGFAATFVLDAVTELLYTAKIKERERAISSRGAGAAVAFKILDALRLGPNDEDAEKAGQILHWTIGVGSGIVAGFLADEDTISTVSASAMTAAGMLCFDEFGMSAIGAMPPSWRYPWQSNFRSAVGHATYGAVLALTYAYLTRLANLRN